MMGLDNADKRRGLRSIVQAIVVLLSLYFVWEWADKLDADGLREMARFALIIVAIGTVGYQLENGLRAFKLTAGANGVTIEGEGDAAQAVADSAQHTADVIKDETK